MDALRATEGGRIEGSPPRSPGEASARVDALSGLRFLAAAAILLFHVGGPLFEGAPRWAERIRVGGHVWVGLFYILSGFVLAHAHPTPMDGPARRGFLVARLARLYPAYLLAFVLSAPFALEQFEGDGLVGGAKAFVLALACMLLIQAWWPPIARAWNAPGWSTSVVASFYLAFPRILSWLAPRSRAALWRIAVGAWLLNLALPVAYLVLQPEGPDVVLLPREPTLLAALKFYPLARIGEFVTGVALGLLVRKQGISIRRAGGWLAVAALILAVAVLAWDGAPYLLLHNGLLLPLFGIALVGLASDRGGLLARLLGSSTGRVLGDASFALYALQDPLWRWARGLHGPREPASPLFVMAFCAVAVGVAVAASHWMERPARRWLRRVLSAPPPRPHLVAGERTAGRPAEISEP